MRKKVKDFSTVVGGKSLIDALMVIGFDVGSMISWQREVLSDTWDKRIGDEGGLWVLSWISFCSIGLDWVMGLVLGIAICNCIKKA